MKLILAVGFALVSGFTQAAKQVEIPVEVTTVQLNEYVEFSISTGNSTMSVTTLIGEPTPIQQGRQEMSSVCNFSREWAGTTIDATYSVDASTGMAAMVLPLERTTSSLKAYVTISKKSAQDQDWVVINKDCKLPVGTTSSAGISLVDTFEWGKPTKLKLSDGSTVVVTANKAKEAGIDFEKLSKAIQAGEVSVPAN